MNNKQKNTDETEVYFYSEKQLRSFFLDWYEDTEIGKEKIGGLQRAVASEMNPANPELGLFKFRNMLQTKSNYSYNEWGKIYQIVEKFDPYFVASDFF